jgi:SnoaL-like domain
MQLTDLYGRYCHAVDADDAELIVSMFLPEGAFHRTNTSVAFPELKSFVGQAELLEFFGTWAADIKPHQHWISNVWFEGDAASGVTGHASWGIFNRGPEAGAILALGNYVTTLSR